MEKSKGKITKPVKVRKPLNITRPIRRMVVLILGGFICVSLTIITLAVMLMAGWLAASGGWDGSFVIASRTVALNPTLATVIAWTIIITLVISTSAFYYLVISLYRKP